MHKPSGSYLNLSVLGDSEYATPVSADGLSEPTRAAVVADSTGFSGEEWMEVLASEMHRKGISISERDLFSIRLACEKRPGAERRTCGGKWLFRWCRESLLDRYEEFLEVLLLSMKMKFPTFIPANKQLQWNSSATISPPLRLDFPQMIAISPLPTWVSSDSNRGNISSALFV